MGFSVTKVLKDKAAEKENSYLQYTVKKIKVIKNAAIFDFDFIFCNVAWHI